MKDVIGIIPARYDSERLPGKVLQKIGRITILESVYQHAMRAKTLDRIIIATDSNIIAEEARHFGAEVFITSSDCTCGTERVAEVAEKISGKIFVNIQADEPLVPDQAIDLPVEEMLKNRKIVCCTPATRIRTEQELYNPDITKVVMDRNGFALFFSASLLPFPRVYFTKDRPFFKKVDFFKHIGVYAFRKNFLLRFKLLPRGPLEKFEQLEQLRMLENGYKIKVTVISKDSISVDSLKDLDKLKVMGHG
ncbi:MAG: 3-deoxy-manno-octulosonate cytidylyltransferase [Candidatus Omnitrophica bacterium]|nr:3-deoxy-manno-octulosonate cytidylyltransferase [Candidatus Omnitrophota bacterium]MCM8828342.1 3-deoxy-manno-octulosonate cytidylyltransferase [Candidatus Omnitrophota bacterium]